MDRNYDISALIVTYNPNLNKLYMTLRSFLLQEGVKLQIIVADDGSKEDYFDEITELFESYHFTDFELVKNVSNVGTVKNLASGFTRCQGKYVKSLSPGDFITGTDIIKKWISYMDEEQLVMSGTDYICYCDDDNGNEIPMVRKLYPQRKNLYGKELKIDYLLCNDLFLGAAVMCETETMGKYIDMIIGKVKYAEDNMFRLMIFNDEKIGFFNMASVIYETGNGISTNGSKEWKVLIEKDWMETNSMLMKLQNKDVKFCDDLYKILHKNEKRGGGGYNVTKYLQYFSIKSLIINKFRMKLKPRFSSEELPNEWLKRLKNG